jgi:hypothetical protein
VKNLRNSGLEIYQKHFLTNNKQNGQLHSNPNRGKTIKDTNDQNLFELMTVPLLLIDYVCTYVDAMAYQ